MKRLYQWLSPELTRKNKNVILKCHLLLFYATTMNHFSIRLWRGVKSGFYTTTGNDQLSGYTERNLQSPSQSTPWVTHNLGYLPFPDSWPHVFIWNSDRVGGVLVEFGVSEAWAALKLLTCNPRPVWVGPVGPVAPSTLWVSHFALTELDYLLLLPIWDLCTCLC